MDYKLPPLTDEFISQLIFCMEDQGNIYYLDLERGELVESNSDKSHRYLELPPWKPADGYRTMEKFVSKLRNPIYRERLGEVLQSGKGVFRQFKDVLSQQPTLERLWYYFKDREMRKQILRWYEINDEAFRLEALGEEAPEERPTHLILEDFIFTTNYESHKEEVDHLYEISKEELISEAPHALDLLREDGNGVIIALTLNGQVAGFIRYKEEEEVTKITFYAIAKEYRGLGLFHALFDALVETLQTSEVIVPFIGDSLKVLQMFEGVTHQVISKSISLPIEEWQEG
ncbi:MAG: UPF0158 family protein [Sphaerochaetaceae bacterium]|jgi:ribosomal protein S18 acetylase RimI-like enzyme|nr:UPF0158 family protein [Sphaerochaetaceae bacterium]HHU88758.1 GNAT family N-acetyltransferase [Spirochaetales bacterium]